MESLPVIDMSSQDREASAKKLVEAMETVGFVYLDNVPGYNKDVEEQLHKLATWFFAQPLEEKLTVSSKKWNKDAKGVFRGYIPINVAEDHLREQYEMGEDLPDDDPDKLAGNPIYESTPWPRAEGGEAYHRAMQAHYHVMLDTGMEFMRLLCMGLGFDEHYFDAQFLPKSCSSLRIMHYPPYHKEEPTFTCEEHFDSTFITLLITFGYRGLEILRDDGTWTPVAPRPGSLVVNIGELLSRITNRRFKATWHRVRDLGGDRYSVPFFFEPHFNGKFHIPDDDSTLHYGPWIVRYCRKYKYQYGHLPDYP